MSLRHSPRVEACQGVSTLDLKQKRLAFQHGIANTAYLGGRRGGNLHVVDPELWQFGRGKPGPG